MKRQAMAAAAGVAVLCGILAPIDASATAAAPSIFQVGMLKSTNFPKLCVRHSFFTGELSRCPGDHQDASDFYFKAVRIAGHTDLYRLKATNGNLPGHYLRHQNFRIVLSKVPPKPSAAYDLFLKDSSFYLRKGLNGTGISFESWNFPGWYIRHRNFHLYISKSGDPNDRPFKADASFISFVKIDDGPNLIPVPD